MVFSSQRNGLAPRSTPRELPTTVNGEQGSSSTPRPSSNTPVSTAETQAHNTEINGIGANSSNGIQDRDAILQDRRHSLRDLIDEQDAGRSRSGYTVLGYNGALDITSPPNTETSEAVVRSSGSMQDSEDASTQANLRNQTGYSHQNTPHQHADHDRPGVQPPEEEEIPTQINHTSRRHQVAHWFRDHFPWSPVRRHNRLRRMNGLRRLREVTGHVDRVFR